MDGDVLCRYCDNKLQPETSKCDVCNADVEKDFVLIKKLVSKESNGKNDENISVYKNKDNLKKNVLVSRGIDKEVFEGFLNNNTNNYGVNNKNNNQEKINEDMKVNLSEECTSIWICSFCTLQNKSSLISCGACFQAKELSTTKNENKESEINNFMIIKEENIENNIKKDKIKKINNEDIKVNLSEECTPIWICSFCTFQNECSLISCATCFKAKVSGMTKNENKESEINKFAIIKENNIEKNIKKDKIKEIKSKKLVTEKKKFEILWSCTFCGFNNKNVDKSCTSCNKMKNLKIENINKDIEKDETMEMNEKKKTVKETKTVEEIWTCQFCELNNKKEDECCAKCDKIKIINKEVINEDGDNDKNIKYNNESDQEHESMTSSSGHPWECMGCNFINDMATLKCYDCGIKNQIFRLCTFCDNYFIMNDFDNKCVDCLKRSSFCDGRTSTENIVHKEAGPGQRKFSALFNVLQRKKLWVCIDETCKTKMTKNESCCTKCGLNKEDKTIPRLEDVKVKEKDKRWRCENEKCHAENKNKAIFCKDCGKYKMTSEVYVNKSVAKIKEKTWLCDGKKCKTKNKSDALKCKKCEKSRPESNNVEDYQSMLSETKNDDELNDDEIITEKL